MLFNGQLLENDDEIEYFFTQQNNPLIVYVPTDLSNDEFRDYTKITISMLESYKQSQGQVNANMNQLQIEIDTILDLHTQTYEATIPKPLQQHSALSTQLSLSQVRQQRQALNRSQSQIEPIEIIDLDDFDPSDFLMSQTSVFSSCPMPSQRSITPSTQFSEYYERLSLRQKSIRRINVKPLIERIDDLIRMFGGPQLAFDMEWKIRLFVIEVLNYALILSSRTPNFYMPPPPGAELVPTQEGPDCLDLTGDNNSPSQLYPPSRVQSLRDQQQSQLLRIDGEKGIEQFGQRVQPDLVI